jgi:uncharacterized protein YjiS (DUF1127 family)
MSTVDLRTFRARHDPLGAAVARRGRAFARRMLFAVQRLQLWRDRARQRRQLACLNDRLLRDIGLTRADVFAESSKPFWQP